MTRRDDYQGALSDEEDGGNDASPQEHFEDEEVGSEGSLERHHLEIDGTSSKEEEEEDDDDIPPPKGTNQRCQSILFGE